MSSLARPLIILVLGECGDGKSSLIRHFYRATDDATKQRIFHQLHPGKELPQEPVTGDSIRGVTKVPIQYPVRMGEREVILIDTPGIGDADVSAAEILHGIVGVLEHNILNGAILCSSMPKKRITVGQNFCARLISEAIDEDCKWENFVLVGTQKDMYSQRGKPRQEAWESWRCEMVQAVNDKCDGNLTKSALVSADPDPDFGGMTDVAELIEKISCYDERSTMTYRNLSSTELAGIMNEAIGDTVVTAAEYQLVVKEKSIFSSGYWKSSFAKLNPSYWVGTSKKAREERNFHDLKKKLFRPTSTIQITSIKPEVEISAVISSVLYSVSSKAELDAQLAKNFGERSTMRFQHTALINGDKEHVYQPIAVLVKEGENPTMFVAWRGSKSVMDFLTDVNAAPVVGPFWDKLCDDIKVHSGMHSMVQNDIFGQFEKMVSLVSRYDVRKIVFAGHSLGGGLAQIALLSAFGQTHSRFGRISTDHVENEKMAKTFARVEFSAVVFAAPMVFHLPSDLRKQSKEVVKELERSCTNFVFGQDMVPRFPRHVHFWRAALTEMVSSTVEQSVNEMFLSIIWGGAAAKVVKSNTQKYLEELDQRTIDEMSQYQHTSKICHFRSFPPFPMEYSVENENALDKLLDLIERLMQGRVVKDKAILTPGEFGEVSTMFVGTEEERAHLLDFHSVCPSCMGNAVKSRQQGELKEIKEGIGQLSLLDNDVRVKSF